MRYGREMPGHPFNARALLTRALIVAQRRLLARGALAPLRPDCTGQAASDALKALLLADAPVMAARFGTGELEATLRHLDRCAPGSAARKTLRLLAGRCGPFWWDNSIRAGICWNAGLFPSDDATLDRFGARMLADCRALDLLASWVPGEARLRPLFFPQARVVPLDTLEPYGLAEPWTAALAGRRVLVVHPFEATLRQQYARRERLFANPAVLPEFELMTYRAVQSIAGNPTPFATWFDALARMCDDLAARDFDIALIGAGAYGLPLAAHVKRLGRKAVHMGGATQLLFGIRGARWDRLPRYAETLYNEAWTRPLAEDRPPNHQTVEGGTYW